MTKPRTGQAGEKIDRQEFHLRFHGSFGHPDFEKVSAALAQVEEEVRNVARAVAELRENRLSMPDAGLERPRPK